MTYLKGRAKTGKALVAIALIAGVIRLATSVSPTAAAVLVGVIALGSTGYGLYAAAPAHRRPWLVSWFLIGFALAAVVANAIVDAASNGLAATGSAAALVLRFIADALGVAGFAYLVYQRRPDRSAEVLATVLVGAATLWFVILSLVVVPIDGWLPGREVPATVLPLFDLVLVWLTGSLMSFTEHHPTAYRYLLGAFICLFFSDAIASSRFLSGHQASPIALNAVVLWAASLWGCAILHPSQRRALDPVPFRTSRPGWAHVGLMLIAALSLPSVIGIQSLIHARTQSQTLTLGATLLPVLIIAYLFHQVFARSAAEYRAQHDALTGVCNRVLFDDRLASCIANPRGNGRFAVMFLDLDHFKSVNDSLGHSVGNQLLQSVVKRVQNRLRPADTLARLGGDEFAVLVPDVSTKEGCANVADRILEVFSEPFNVDGRLLPIQASIGIALHPEDGDDVETILKNADTAMYQAKATGRNTYVIYDPMMSSRAQIRFALESSLRMAVNRGELTLHYQPKMETATGLIVGVEALARWYHPRVGFVPPPAFVTLAEETSLISTLGEWVLERACLQARQWQDEGFEDLSVAVNVSPRQFARNSVVQLVSDVIERTELDPKLLELEVTESVLLEHVEEAAASLAELRAMGIRCSIDDFGTGYSALTYLTDIPVDAIKIDPSFIRKIDSEVGAAPIVGAVIMLAHSLDLKVIAEGVETNDQFRFLQDNGCDYVQGFRFSPAVPADEIARLMRGPRKLLENTEATLAAPAEDPFVLPTRLRALLAGAIREGGWTTQPTQEDIEEILAALEIHKSDPIGGPTGFGFAPARMAIGTLAGLASITGGLSAAGVLPKATQTIAVEVLHQATGITAPTTPQDQPSDTQPTSGISGDQRLINPGPGDRINPDVVHGGGSTLPEQTSGVEPRANPASGNGAAQALGDSGPGGGNQNQDGSGQSIQNESTPNQSGDGQGGGTPNQSGAGQGGGTPNQSGAGQGGGTPNQSGAGQGNRGGRTQGGGGGQGNQGGGNQNPAGGTRGAVNPGGGTQGDRTQGAANQGGGTQVGGNQGDGHGQGNQSGDSQGRGENRGGGGR